MVAAAALAAATSAIGDDATATFVARGWGLVVRYPAALEVSPSFRASYLDAGGWRVSYAAGAGTGTAIVALRLPDLTSPAGKANAELRIGASRDPDTLASCLTYGMNSGDNVEQRTRSIGGVRFTEVPDNGDAAMMQTIRTDDFRAVDHGICWAVDIVRYSLAAEGSPPDYTPAQLAALRGVLDGISFDASDPTIRR